MTTLQSVAAKQRELAALRTSIRPGALDNLEHSQRVDITYTSNAIEGNTLTAGETALATVLFASCVLYIRSTRNIVKKEDASPS